MRSPSHLVTLLLVLAFPPTVLAQADEQTASLGRTLKQGKAPAHRVQAARLLGDSEDPQALPALCAGLGDESGEVRGAVAAALAKLGEPDGVGCLEAHKDEPDATAKEAMASALRTLRELKDRPPRVYVVMGEIKDMTGSLSPELLKLTEARMRRRLFQVGAALVPAGEAGPATKGKQKPQVYRLMPQILAGPGGGLKVQVLCSRHPSNKMLGQVDVQAANAEPGELLAALAPRVIDEAAETFKWK